MHVRERKIMTPTTFAYNLIGEYANSGRKIRYQELYDAMAPVFGWPMRNKEGRAGHAWFKRLPLAQVGSLCGERGEPCLSSIVRRKDKTIGKGYQTAHFNCYGVRITSSHGCGDECGNCRQAILKAAQQEAWKVFDHWWEPIRDELNNIA
jgi:hypothetical protein